MVQFTPGRDKAANRERIAWQVGAAIDAGSDLVVLPEAAMHPFGPADESLAACAEPLDGPFVSNLRSAVGGAGVTVLAGMFETAAGDERVWNTVVTVDRSGLVGTYRKIHLFDALGTRESDRLLAGDPTAAPLVHTVAGLGVGVLTCYDLRFPEMARRLVDAGATVLAVPAAWAAGPLKEEHWVTLARARAIENTCYLAGAGQGPPECAGRSLVVDPMGVVVAQCGEADGAVTAEVSAERVSTVRAKLPALAHRRFAVRNV